MENFDVNMVTVENLMPHLRKSYGHTQKIGRDKALRGVATGIYKIVNDPLDAILFTTNVVKPAEKLAQNGQAVKYSVTIIILVHNQLSYTKKCIDSIKKYSEKYNYRLIVVDNGSNDGSHSWLISQLCDNDILLCNHVNRGFSVANNQALSLVKTEYILFLNNDTEIKGDHWLDPFIDNMKDCDIVGPDRRKLLIDQNNHIFIYAGVGTPEDNYNYIEGWCLFGKTHIFKDLGGFDERYSPAYSEDADLSFSAYRKGYRLKQVDNDLIKHFGNKTSQTMGSALNVLSTQNRKKLYNKWIDDEIKNILVRRDGAKGDVLMTTPIIRALKNKYPSAHIIMQTKSPDLIKNNPCIDQVIADVIDNKVYDIDITLRYEDCPGEVRIDSMARQAGVKLINRKMETFFETVQLTFSENAIVIHTGYSWVNRMWPIERWNILCFKLKKMGYDIYCVGDNRTEVPKGVNDLTNKSWDFTATLLKRAKFFIGIDSAVSNLAKAIGCRAYIFYGCVNPSVMLADADEIPLIDSSIDCFGCRDRSTKTYVKCKKKEPYCLTNIKVDDVLNIIKRKEK